MLIHDTEKWISYRNYIIDEVNLRYLDGDIVNTQEDIIKAKDIEISYIEDSNMAIMAMVMRVPINVATSDAAAEPSLNSMPKMVYRTLTIAISK